MMNPDIFPLISLSTSMVLPSKKPHAAQETAAVALSGLAFEPCPGRIWKGFDLNGLMRECSLRAFEMCGQPWWPAGEMEGSRERGAWAHATRVKGVGAAPSPARCQEIARATMEQAAILLAPRFGEPLLSCFDWAAPRMSRNPSDLYLMAEGGVGASSAGNPAFRSFLARAEAALIGSSCAASKQSEGATRWAL